MLEKKLIFFLGTLTGVSIVNICYVKSMMNNNASSTKTNKKKSQDENMTLSDYKQMIMAFVEEVRNVDVSSLSSKAKDMFTSLLKKVETLGSQVK